jgi:hypothetical protein
MYRMPKAQWAIVYHSRKLAAYSFVEWSVYLTLSFKIYRKVVRQAAFDAVMCWAKTSGEPYAITL